MKIHHDGYIALVYLIWILLIFGMCFIELDPDPHKAIGKGIAISWISFGVALIISVIISNLK